jgi:uncharacterized protein (TIGR00251 family)
MIGLRTTAEGVILPVQAQPGARKNAVVGEHAGRLKVAVTQAPEKGKANDAILKVLADALQLSRSQLQLVRGETARQKDVLVKGVDIAALQSRLEEMIKHK